MFEDRFEAGLLLGQQLAVDSIPSDLIIGLARGGVMVAAGVAKQLNKLFDVLVVKKIGSPGQREFAIGAVAPEGISYEDTRMAMLTGTAETYIKSRIVELTDEIRQKTALYRRVKKPLFIDHRAIVLVDDGAATGATMFAAIRWVKAHQARTICVGLPVAPPEVVHRLESEADRVVILETPDDFRAVGQFYRNFPQMTDEEVVQLLS